MSKLTEEERFWRKVSKTDTCWNWTAAKIRGHGTFWVDDNGTPRQTYAHRHSYSLAYGEIPAGKQIDHMCHNRACVNPEHLRVVTNKQNSENIAKPRKSRSGVRGVYWHEQAQKWGAVVKHNYKQNFLGLYDTIAAAEAAVVANRLELFTHNDLDRVRART